MEAKYRYEKRKYIIIGSLLIIAALYIMRLFYLQVISDDYKQFADSNAFLKKNIIPSRGLIYDRQGRLVVYNQPAYDVMLICREVEPFDTLDFCQTLGITREQFDRRWAQMTNRKTNPGYSAYTPQVFITQISAQDYGKLQEKLYKYPGFYVQNRVMRQYNYAAAANVLGNIREVSQGEIDNDEEFYYKRGDYIGDLGVERSYEKYLRGEKGYEILLRDAHGRIKGPSKNGVDDVAPQSGKTLKLSLDIELQKYGEYLMQNKIGAIVAIEPSTGEILAMVSSPTYDPTTLVGRIRGESYSALTKNPYKPLFDRSLMAAYPPGSTFKVTQGLTLLQEQIINEHTIYGCSGGFVAGRLRVGCHPHAAPLPLISAIQTSCNAYFCYGFRAMMDNRNKYATPHIALDKWKDYMVSMGYGYRLGVDLPNEGRGFIPNSKYYSKIYGQNGWRGLTIISIAIGQGEVLATPLQIANLAATVANKGHFYTPHVVKEIQDNPLPEEYTSPRKTMVDSHYYELAIQGMRMAVTGGTCRLANLPDVEVCGKTGTSQNPHGRDHSVFMGFAPMNNPKIAIAVYVENAGFGATFGVPIGSLMMEKYLNGEISPSRQWIEDNMVNSNTLIYSGIKTP